MNDMNKQSKIEQLKKRIAFNEQLGNKGLVEALKLRLAKAEGGNDV